MTREMNGRYLEPMARRAGVTSDETREQLLAATVKVFTERGYDGTRVGEIAKEAGLTSGAIYNHFGSKADLLTAAISSRGPGALGHLLDTEGDTSLVDELRCFAARLQEHGSLMGPLLMETVVASRRDPEVGRVVATSVADREHQSRQLLERAQAAGEVDPELEAAAIARFIDMVALGSVVVGALELGPVSPDAWAAVVHRVIGALQPAQPAHPTAVTEPQPEPAAAMAMAAPAATEPEPEPVAAAAP